MADGNGPTYTGPRLAVMAEENAVRMTVGSLTFTLKPGEATRLGQLLLDTASLAKRKD